MGLRLELTLLLKTAKLSGNRVGKIQVKDARGKIVLSYVLSLVRQDLSDAFELRYYICENLFRNKFSENMPKNSPQTRYQNEKK